jgi:hypothetical protein
MKCLLSPRAGWPRVIKAHISLSLSLSLVAHKMHVLHFGLVAEFQQLVTSQTLAAMMSGPVTLLR